MSNLNAVLETFEKTKEQHVQDLMDLVRIPSVSFEGFPAENVRKSAEAVAKLMRERGLENVEVLELDGAHPYVYGDWLHAPGKPTLLLYAHHDVQPPGRLELWKNPPFSPVIKNGRMHGRGTADDKAGVVVHTAAIASWLKSTGKLPVNVKVIIEGEEEIGSTHLAEFSTKYREKLKSDIMVLTDTGNFDTGVPALTVSLRGLVAFEVKVKAHKRSMHSGSFGGPVVDPAMALCKLLSTVVDADGRVAIPGLWDDVQPLTAQEEAQYAELPLTTAEFRHQANLLPHTKLLPSSDGRVRPFVQMWREPSFSINAMLTGNPEAPANIINDTAWAKIGFRIVPKMDPKKTAELVEAHLRRHAPWGVELEVKLDGEPAGAWRTNPSGPIFDAAIRSLENGYGKKPVLMGAGGSIPFVEPLSNAMGGAPALLIGVEDPYTNAHSENESMDMGDFEKSIKSAIHLYAEVAEVSSKL